MENNVEATTPFRSALRGLKGMLAPLSAKEREIIIMREGLITGTQATLEEVGKHFGVTRERIRQIEAKAHAEMEAFLKDLGVATKH